MGDHDLAAPTADAAPTPRWPAAIVVPGDAPRPVFPDTVRVSADSFGRPGVGPASSGLVDALAFRRGSLTHQQVLELYDAHHDALLRFAALVAPEDGMAEDLVQEAFVRLYKSWRRIREPEKVPAYLRATVANLARGRGRRLSVAQRHRPSIPPNAMSAEEGALRTETANEVVERLRRLPPRQRECLVLRYYQGLTESEIARTLGISIGSVRTHTTRGMAAMSTSLGAPPS